MSEEASQSVKHLIKYTLLVWLLRSVTLIYYHMFLLSLWKLTP